MAESVSRCSFYLVNGHGWISFRSTISSDIVKLWGEGCQHSGLCSEQKQWESGVQKSLWCPQNWFCCSDRYRHHRCVVICLLHDVGKNLVPLSFPWASPGTLIWNNLVSFDLFMMSNTAVGPYFSVFLPYDIHFFWLPRSLSLCLVWISLLFNFDTFWL